MLEFLEARARSIVFALRGLTYVVRSQKNAWIHALATGLVLALGLLLKLSPAEWCWMVFAIGGVWTAEAMNTALELLCDATHPAQHPLIGKAKDVAAASVLFAATASAAIGLLVLVPHLHP